MACCLRLHYTATLGCYLCRHSTASNYAYLVLIGADATGVTVPQDVLVSDALIVVVLAGISLVRLAAAAGGSLRSGRHLCLPRGCDQTIPIQSGYLRVESGNISFDAAAQEKRTCSQCDLVGPLRGPWRYIRLQVISVHTRLPLNAAQGAEGAFVLRPSDSAAGVNLGGELPRCLRGPRRLLLLGHIIMKSSMHSREAKIILLRKIMS